MARGLVGCGVVWGLAWLGAVAVPVLAEGVPEGATGALAVLHGEWADQRQALEEGRLAAVEARLAAEVAWANEQLDRARFTRNVSRQAAAHTAIRLFEGALERVREQQPAELPERTRRDLQGRLDEVRRDLAGIDEAHREASSALRHRIMRRVRHVTGLTDAPLDDPRLLAALESAAVAPEPGAPSGEQPAADDAAAPEAPLQVDASGQAEDWLPLMTIQVAVRALEVVAVPVLDVTAAREQRRTGQTSLLEVVIRTLPERVLLASDPPPVFRAVAVPGHPAPDVLRWPSARNGWTLELRCRPRPGFVTPSALRLDVSEATARLSTKGIAEDPGPARDVEPPVRAQGLP